MRKRFSILFILAFMALAGNCMLYAAEEGNIPVYRCFRIDTPPQIDGELSDNIWGKIPKATGFFYVGSGSGMYAAEQTLVQAVYDSKALYIAFRCLESNIKGLRSQAKDRDGGDVFGDDSIEIFLDVNHDHKTYFQLAANSKGIHYDGEGFNKKWNGEWKTQAGIKDNAWDIEIEIPFFSIGKIPKKGDVWGFNLCRNRRADENKSFSCLFNIGQSFHTPQRFGHLVFSSHGSEGRDDQEQKLNQVYLSLIKEEMERKWNNFIEIREKAVRLLSKSQDVDEFKKKFEKMYVEYQDICSNLEKHSTSLESVILWNNDLKRILSEYKSEYDKLKFYVLFKD